MNRGTVVSLVQCRFPEQKSFRQRLTTLHIQRNELTRIYRCQRNTMNSLFPEKVKLELLLHTAVDHVKGQGVGIGILQQARCAKTGALMPGLLPIEERRYGITRANFSTENVKTRERAELLAILHALGLASSTIKKRCPPNVQLRTIQIFCEHPSVIYTVKHHLRYSPTSLEDEVSGNDRAMIKRVVQAIQKLERRSFEVFLTIANMEDDAQKKVGLAARQRGSFACRQRRQLQHARGRASTAVRRTLENENSTEAPVEEIRKLTSRMQACSIE